MSRECAWCPSTKLTREHLWSDWINGILPESKYEFVRKTQTSPKQTVWKSGSLNAKARVVCDPCNSTWMSDIENNEAKPSLTPLILDTSSRVIPIRILISIAIFLFKTSVIADHMGGGGTPMFTVEERYAFRERRIFPDGISMWIGALEESFRGTYKTLHVIPRAITDNDFGLYIFTFIVGHLVLQLAAAKWATPHLNRILPPIQTESDAKYMAWFWPIAGRIQWPPPKYVPASHLDQLSDRWKTFHMS